MRYHEAANFLLDLRRYRPKPGTESTADLLAFLDDPHEDTDFVQVAGSNGKGSTARLVEATLRDAGHTVGLYTSPHFDDLRERVRVDGRHVPKAAVVDFVEAIQPRVNERAANGDAPTFFEVVTALALWHFGEQDVDVAVLEVGIGGKYDATSVVDPVASAVTSVTLEHTSVLGDTIEEIARDKAHVAPADAPLVTATNGDALAAVREVAGDVVTVGDGGDVEPTYHGRVSPQEAAVSLDGPDWRLETRIPLLGEFQAENAGVAAALVREVADVDTDTLARGLRKAHWPGRFEVMDTDPLVVLDGAHNPGACEALADTLDEFEYDALHVVLGAMHDKDHAGMADALPTPDTLVACDPETDRAEDPDVLANVFRDADAGDARTIAAVETAVDHVLRAADPDDCVVATGSLFTIAEARRRWTRPVVPTAVRDAADATRTLDAADVPVAGQWNARDDERHHVVRTRLQSRQAHALQDAMHDAGGTCVLSGLDAQSNVYLDAVLTGTRAAFRDLLDDLHTASHGLPQVAAQVRRTLDLDYPPVEHGYPWEDGTAVMGILNVTPDSFHDGGEYAAVDDAVARGREMAAHGADVIDVGGESTRPGAEPVAVDEEISRVVPTIERLADEDVLLSVDTRKAAVGRAALEAGADILNDVTGLEDPEMRFLAAEYDVPIVVMHSIEAPVVPEKDVQYDDVTQDVIDSLRERVLLAEKAGVPRENVIVDPGLGFGKTAAESFELLDRVGEFDALGCPVLVGHSHKSMFAEVEREPGEREHATVAATALAADRGADLVRVHDVKENVAAVRTADATRHGSE